MIRTWTRERLEVLAAEYPTCDLDGLAARLGVTRCALKSKAHKLGVVRANGRRRWSGRENAILRRDYGRLPTAEVAASLGRPVSQVHRRAFGLGLCFQRRVEVDEAFLARVRELNTQGYPDEEIAGVLGCNRRTVHRHRHALGLPDQSHSQRARQAIRERTARQLEAAGLPTIGHLRVRAYRDFASRHGWPEDLRPRSVQILDLLASTGVPLTRRQIADGLGMPWKGSRASLRSNDPEGSYLAHLTARGLVLRLPRVVKGACKGGACDAYALGSAALAILRERAALEQEA